MNSADSTRKKPPLCRFFASSGSCFYGDECQFLHEAPAAPLAKVGIGSVNSQGITLNGTSEPRVTVDGSNGDQFFSATFTSSASLHPEFQPFSASKDALDGSLNSIPEPVKSYMPINHHAAGPPGGQIDESALAEQFNSLGLIQHPPPHPKFQSPVKIHGLTQGESRMYAQGRNAEAPEFVPKSTNGTASPSLTHSASTPSFASYAQMASMGQRSALATPVTQSLALSAGTSPLGSPGMSPQGSPHTARRNQSPANLTLNMGQPQHVQENIGGTTFFYTQEELNSQMQGVVLPSFTMNPGILPHVAHMKLKANMPTFFMPDEIKMEILNRNVVTLMQIDMEANPDIPSEVDNYHGLFPLEPPPPSPLHKSSTFGYPTTCYKAVNTKDGLTYCLRRIHGFRLVNTKRMALIDLWKKINHSNIVQLREVFTTKAFGDHSMVFVYDFHPTSETLMSRHFSQNAAHMNGYANPFSMDGGARPFSAIKGANGPRQHAGLLPESMIWSYVVQLTSALRTIHAHSLACRVMDPTKILLTDKSRIRLNCLGIFDVLTFDANQTNPFALMSHYQQDDLVSLGKVVLALACNSIMAIQHENLATSMDLVSRNYSSDLKNLILYLLSNQSRLRSVNDIMPMIGARFYTQLDSAQLRNDVLENELAKEVENGRLFRLLTKLGSINERPEFHLDPAWSETGDRYMLKLFRDYLFHQVDDNGVPWIDMAHIVQCLNKLDAGVPEKVCLMSRDEQSMLVVTYAELKQCFESAFNELITAGRQASMVVAPGAEYS